MKTILISITLIFSFIALTSCTNDEGEQDVELLTPNEETQEKQMEDY